MSKNFKDGLFILFLAIFLPICTFFAGWEWALAGGPPNYDRWQQVKIYDEYNHLFIDGMFRRAFVEEKEDEKLVHYETEVIHDKELGYWSVPKDHKIVIKNVRVIK